MTPNIRPSLAASALTLVLALPAGATSYVMMEDAALADQAPLIVDGRIEAVARAADAPYGATEYTVAVARTIQGAAPGGTVTVRVLGAIPRDDGPWRHVWGVPRFQPGERVLLFLSPRPDGRFGLVQLALGAFRGVSLSGRLLAFRPDLVAHGVAGGEERVRDYDAFADWLADRARGITRPADYFAAPPPGGTGRLAERFQLFEDKGLNFRWFEFDAGQTVDFRSNSGGQPGMNGGGFDRVTDGLWTWNLDNGSNVALRNKGTTGSSALFDLCDGENLVNFEDPHDEIAGSYNCAQGGTLAKGGVCANGTGQFQGKQYWRITEGDILTQDGAGCAFGEAGGNVGEFIFGHEAGHTLGIRHSCGDPGNDPGCTDPVAAAALMVASVPPRASQGAVLGADDRAALAALYPETGGGGGGGGGGEEEPDDGWLSSGEVPGFRFQVTIVPGGTIEPIPGAKETVCLAETLCVSGAVPGRVEVQLRVVGPKPNGKLWPTFVKFTTSRVEIEVEQVSTGETKSYVLEGVGPGSSELNGLFDRSGFDP